MLYDTILCKMVTRPQREGVCFAKNPSDNALSSHGFLQITDPGCPDYDPAWQTIRRGGEVQGDVYVKLYDVLERDIEDVRAEKRAQMAAAKNAARDAGFEIDGVLWDSDYHARIAYAEVAQIIASDPTYTAAWKASEGVWVTMDAATLALIQAAGRTHIETCFVTYATRLAEIDAATTAENVAAITW